MKKCICIFIMLSILFINTGESFAFTYDFTSGIFNDVESEHWASYPIIQMGRANIINGFEGKLFKPDDKVTRAQFAKMLLLSADMTPDSMQRSGFKDMSDQHWAKPYAESAKEFFADSISEDYFYPDNSATRQEVVAAVVRALKMQDEKVDISQLRERFSDFSEIDSKYGKYIAIAVKNGLISGYPDGTFRPKGKLTRAEAAKIIYQDIFVKQPVASVNGKEIPFRDFLYKADKEETYLKAIYGQDMWTLPTVDSIKAKALKNILDSTIYDSLLLYKAHEMNIKPTTFEVNTDYDNYVKEMGGEHYIRKKLLSEADVSDYIKDRIKIKKVLDRIKNQTVTEEEIRHFYNSNRDNYEYRTISHIYISNLKRTDAEAVKLAAEVSQKAKSGQDFYQLKGTYCEELTDKNDYMYEFKRGTREKLFEDIVFSLSVNQVSNPIKTSYGYYIVKVLEKNYYSYDSVKEQIKKELNFSKNYSVMLQTIEQWFKEAEIKININ